MSLTKGEHYGSVVDILTSKWLLCTFCRCSLSSSAGRDVYYLPKLRSTHFRCQRGVLRELWSAFARAAVWLLVATSCRSYSLLGGVLWAIVAGGIAALEVAFTPYGEPVRNFFGEPTRNYFLVWVLIAWPGLLATMSWYVIFIRIR